MNLRPSLAVLLLLALVSTAPARVGRVETREGAAFEGQIRLRQDGVLLASAAQDLRLLIPASRIIRIRFEDPPPDPEDASAWPEDWLTAAVGEPQPRATGSRQAGVLSLRGAGLGFGGPADSFFFAFQPARQGAEIEARLDYVHSTRPSARAGLMIRGGLDPSAPMVAISLSPSRLVSVQWRAAGQPTGRGFEFTGPSPSCWLRLRREGSLFSASFSRNGRQWILAHQFAFPMTNTPCLAGLALASGRSDLLNSTPFKNVRLSARSGNSWLQPRVQLTSGSTLSGSLDTASASGLALYCSGRRVQLPLAALARVLFLEGVLPGRPGRRGVSLAGGDFVDGDFLDIVDRRLRLNSLLYGPREFDVESQVLALVLHPTLPVEPAVELLALDGSLWQASELRFDDNEAVFIEPALGELRLPIHQLRQIRWRR